MEIPSSNVFQKKAHRLFTERVRCLLPKIEIPQDQIIALQIEILKLDWYGENAITLEKSIIDKLWSNIKSAIRGLLTGIGETEISELLADMQTFLTWEMGLRENQSPTSRAIKDYYRIKSCDLRLMRRIAQKIGNINETDSVKNEEIDILGEILDDIEDYGEDQDNPRNGNRFVYLIKEKSVENAVQEYMIFINGIATENLDSRAIIDTIKRLLQVFLENSKKNSQL